MEYDCYVAGPFFNNKEREAVDAVVNFLRDRGLKVYSPKEHKIPDGENMPNMLWANMVFNEDVKAINESEEVIVLNWGLYSDSGTAWEAGYAFAKKKNVFVILCGDTTDYSLMCLNGADLLNTLEGFLKGEKSHLVFKEVNQK